MKKFIIPLILSMVTMFVACFVACKKDLPIGSAGLYGDQEESAKVFAEEWGIDPETGEVVGYKKVSDDSAAPRGFETVEEKKARSYIEKFAPVAITEMRKYGIPASISLAQGLVESGAGRSTLAKQNNNHFGIKCFSRRCKKGHCSNHTDDTHKDFFRKFQSPWESWRAHSNILMNERFIVLKGKDYKGWAKGLKELGYATDRRYDDKLIEMIEGYNLHRYDKM